MESRINNNHDDLIEQYIHNYLRHPFGLDSNADDALLPAVAEIVYGECCLGLEVPNNMKVNKLKKFIKLVKEDKTFLDKFKQGGTTFEQLQERYGAALAAMTRAEQEKMDNTEYTRNTNYTIKQISTMEEAYEYGKDSGVDGKGQLYFTTCESSWEDFTSHSKNKCYCILRNDYKDVLCERGEGYPKDNYGLSMIFVFISPWGELINSNVRWNHGYRDFSDVDNMFSKSEISNIIGQRFDEAFNCEDGVRQFEQEVLQNGTRHGVVVYYNRQGYMVDGNGHLKRNEDGDLFEFDDAYDFIEGFACVMLKGKFNFINRNGNYLSKQWFDLAFNFEEGFASVELNGKWNFIDKDCHYISEQWFDFTCGFSDGFGNVKLNDKYNFIDKDCKYLSEQWFDYATCFIEGFAGVELNGKWNYIDREGNLLSKQWFDSEGDFSNGLAKVKLDGKWYKIDTNGNLHSES